MSEPDRIAARPGRFRRWLRLPIVLLLTFGLLQALIHCADDGFALASHDPAGVTIASDGLGVAPSLPEQHLPSHSGHCLSHVTVQAAAPAGHGDRPQHRAPAFGQDQSPSALAGLPLFKPPRA